MPFIASNPNWSTQVSLLKAAIRYSNRWPVFPVHTCAKGICSCGNIDCSSPGKHPRTADGFKSATTDIGQVRRWWSRTANIGIQTGNGLFVLDVDGRHDGDVSLSVLQKQYGELPDTLTSLTGGGGQHFYFKTTKEVQCSTSRVGQGIDVRGDGGYVVAPPSSHLSGTDYVWDAGAPDELAEVPEWLLSLALDKAAKPPPSPEAVIEGGRNTHLFAVGRSMRSRGCNQKAIVDELLRVNANKCKPPLDEKEVRTIGRSASRYDPNSEAPEWVDHLKLDGNMNAKPTPGNAAVYLLHHEKWDGVLQWNEFTDEVFWAAKPPDGLLTPSKGEVIRDEHYIYAQHWLSKNCGPTFSLDHTAAAMNAVAKSSQNRHHPIREWLDQLKWDEKPRLDKWLITYVGCKDTEVVRAISRWWMVSAIARVRRPGCQADHVLVLEGGQGIGKSSAVRLLGGGWYLGHLPKMSDKHAGLGLQGSWIVEIGELDSMRGVSRAAVKDFLSQTEDVYRRPYSRSFTRRPRQCVFVGTTNEGAYLEDAENRRFWPVKCGRIALTLLAEDRDQLWAEADWYYQQGAVWHPEKGAVQDGLTVEQENRAEHDAWEPRITLFLLNKDFVTTLEILQNLGFEMAHIERRHQMRVGDVLRRLAWRTDRPVQNGRRVRGYCPTPKWYQDQGLTARKA